MSGAPPLTLARLNSMNQTGFTTALGFAFELSPWVVQRAWDERPFDTVEGLHAAMMRVLDASTVADKLALIRAHPELAGKAAIAKALTAESNAEQASAGLDRLTAEEFERFHALNAAYAQRFGIPFIIAVRPGATGDPRRTPCRSPAGADSRPAGTIRPVPAPARRASPSCRSG